MQDLVLKLINQTQKPIFLTGRAGTGKTTLLKKIVAQTYKNYVIVAPTAVAAINAGGVTIHSMFQLPFHPFLPTDAWDPDRAELHFETQSTLVKHFRINKEKKKLLRNLELLVIDEVSMVRPDLLDAVDLALKHHRQDHRPFGGVQILFIGDLMQLPPIVKREEWSILSQFYASKYFFDAKSLQQQEPVYIELTKIYRQSDEKFIHILQQLRENTVDKTTLEILEQHVDFDFETRKNPGYIVLTTHNKQSDEINQKALDEIDSKVHVSPAEVVGDFPKHAYPIPEKLSLKVGAQVMFVKNDTGTDRKFFNGKIGRISRLIDDEIYVYFEEEGKEILVEKYSWENIKYHNTPNNEIKEEILGTFTHYPLRLAWAITIHKSQGLTFEKAAIDISQIFAPGQAYVALSRLTSIAGLKLLAPIGNRKISAETALLNFTQTQKNIRDVEKNVDQFSLEFLIQKAIAALDNGSIQVWSRKMQKERRDASDKSIFATEDHWITTLIQEMDEHISISAKFASQLKKINKLANKDADYIHERIDSASAYFDGCWISVEKKLLRKKAQLAIVSKAQKYKTLIDELEELVYLTIQRIRKLKKANAAIVANTPLDKDTIHSQELADQKSQWIKEIKSESGIAEIGLDQVFEESQDSQKKTKVPSHEISLKLWKEVTDLDKIATIRKLKKSTILSHLIKAVQEEKLPIEELVEEEKMRQIQTRLGDQEFETLTQMRNALDDQYEFSDLRLFNIWSGKK